MTRSEKRNFKLFAGKSRFQDGKDYLRLFDALEEMDEYDEKLLLDRFGNEPYFRHIRSVKRYLYQQIIRCLKNMNEDASSVSKAYHYLLEIRILYDKGLHKNCAKTIKKAKDFAAKHELLSTLLELTDWELKIAVWNKDARQIESSQGAWIETVRSTLEKYQEIHNFWKLSWEILPFFFRKGRAHTGSEHRLIENVLANPVLTEKKKTFIIEINRLSVIYNCLLILDRTGERYEALKNLIGTFDRYPHQIEQYLNEYFYNLCIFVNLAIRLRKMNTDGVSMTKLTEIYEKRSEDLNFTNKLGHLSILSDFLIKQGEFKAAMNVMPEIDSLIHNSKQEIDPIEKIHLHELKALVYFCNHDLKSAQRHVQEIINSETDIRVDLQTAARLFYLIIQFEEGEFQHLEYAWRSTYRFMRKKNTLTPPDMVVLQFLKNAANIHSRKDLIKALTGLRLQMAPFAETFLTEFPFTEWMDSKIENKPLEEMVRRTYLQNE